MFPSHPRPFHARGSALLITLSILVLIVAILLAFFTQSTLSRQISFSSAGQYRADALARTALDTVTGDLRSEIVAGSQAFASNGAVFYLPATNSTILPFRSGDQGFANLVKQSTGGSNFWAGNNYGNGIVSPVRAAPNNSTQSPSANGRYIKINRWNRPGFLGDPGSGATPLLPAGAYVPPDWIIVTRQGAVTNAAALPAMGVLSDRAADNGNYAVGRFAYAIYNEGALFDVNVGGYPSSLVWSAFSTQHGLLPQIDLGSVPGVVNAGAVVEWRNRATAASVTAYTNSVMTATNGFVSPPSGDQAFVTRQDLIHYAQDNSGQLQTSALPNLSTFTRDVDGPSWYPDPNRAKATPPGSVADDVLNPNVLKIRVKTAFLRPDGTQAVVGEPLLKHRFPLSRLALFQNPGGANAALIQKYFAMKQRGDGLWDYIDPDASGSGTASTTLPVIKTLDQISGREPTFWELLQAGILTGSLGVDVTGPEGCVTKQNQNPTRQIFAIGLSIIDQYDSDDTPTVLNFAGTPLPSPENDAATLNLPVAGVENLPYIAWIAHNQFRDNITSVPANPPASYVDGYLMFALWNPHRNAATAAPGNFRIRVNGKTYLEIYNPAAADHVATISPSITHTDDVISFRTTSGRYFSPIAPLKALDASGTVSPYGQFPYPTASAPKELGILIGQVIKPNTPDYSNANAGTFLLMGYNTPLTIVLEKQVGTNWIPYQIIPYYNGNLTSDGTSFADITTQMNAGTFDATPLHPPMVIAFAHSDPRTFRFGMGYGSRTATQSMLGNQFNLIGTAQQAISYSSNGGALTPTFSAATFSLADYAYNQASTPHYQDRDAVIRKGDSNPVSTATHGADSPFSYGDARPVMLNRPFASVAEMGYAFRDDPWRTLNFSSSDSADGGLLDLFCLNENKNADRAGVLDVNEASQQTLATVLINAYRDPAAADGTPLTSAQAGAIASAMKAQLGTGTGALVLRNASDLPTLTSRVAAALPDTFKFKREAFVRSFADILNTRTWNLMIDIVAQSGRYGPAARTVNDFSVEGERRYWVHVAIDRFTGKVVETQIEAVTE